MNEKITNLDGLRPELAVKVRMRMDDGNAPLVRSRAFQLTSHFISSVSFSVTIAFMVLIFRGYDFLPLVTFLGAISAVSIGIAVLVRVILVRKGQDLSAKEYEEVRKVIVDQQ